MDKKKKYKEEVKENDEILVWKSIILHDAFEYLSNSLEMYLPEWHVEQFICTVGIAFHQRRAHSIPNPTELYPQWAELIQSLNITEEMKLFIDQDQTLVQKEISSELSRIVGETRMENLRDVVKRDAVGVAYLLTSDWEEEVSNRASYNNVSLHIHTLSSFYE